MREAMAPPIPPILDEELPEAESALVAAAHSYRRVLFLAAKAEPKVFDLVMKHGDLLKSFRHRHQRMGGATIAGTYPYGKPLSAVRSD